MGGAIAKAVQEGAQVDVLVMTDGVMGGSEPNLKEIREAEARNSIQILECRSVTSLRQADRGLRPSQNLIEKIRDQITQGAYCAVFFPSPVEPHPDHRTVAQIGWDALRKSGFPCEAISYEISTQGPCNTLVDISSVVDRKREAMLACTSQIKERVYTERVLALNKSRTWSLPIEVTFAEAFYRWDRRDAPLSAQLNQVLRLQQSLEALPNTEELVSIIVRTVNRPQMLREAIRSVVSQTYSTIELIVVNDGDDNIDVLVAEEAVGSIVRYTVVHRAPPHGRSRAANDGLAACNGSFICFLDDDDWLLPHHVSTLFSALQPSAAPAAYGIVDSVRIVEGVEVFEYRFDTPFDRIRLAYTNFMPIHSVLFRRSVLEKGCQFDNSLELFEDWNFWIQIANHGDFFFVPELVAKYRISETSGVGVPSTQRDLTAGFRTFIERTRPIWSLDQLEHICRAGLAVQVLNAQLAEAQRQYAQTSANEKAALEATATALESTSSALSNLRAEHERVLQEHQRAMADWDLRVRALLSSRSWKLARLIQFPHRALRAFWRLISIARVHSRNRGPVGMFRAAHALWKREGFAGFRARLFRGVPEPMPNNTGPSGSVFGYFSQGPDGRYKLAARSTGYCYVPTGEPYNLQKILDSWIDPPLLSIVVPVYNTPAGLLEALVDSVFRQWYPHWELILVNDASTDLSIRDRLAAFVDPRIKFLHQAVNGGIAAATQAAAEIASGHWLVFVDHDDLLTLDSLYELAMRVRVDDVDFVYSDEDKIDADGRFFEPHFKPDWSPDAMMSTMFTGHVSALRRTVYFEVGGMRNGVDGCQDWDLVLRVAERTTRIAHIPRVLYHWRVLPESTASDIAAKPYVIEATQRVRRDALQRRGLSGTVEPVPEVPGYFRVNYQPQGTPLVSIVIPTRNHHQLVTQCVESIERLSSWAAREIILVDNGSDEKQSLDAFAALEAAGRVRLVRDDAAFNFSALCNLGRSMAQGSMLLFLNNDTEVLTPDWLERMIGYAQLPHVGAVGAKLLYANGSVQHAGILNLDDGPAHAFLQGKSNAPGYFMRNLLEYNWVAVTGACMMIEAEKFDAVGGFDPAFPVAYNDVELCFRLVERGLFNVVCQSVRLTHYESLSRGLDAVDTARFARMKADMKRLYTKHVRFINHDPFFNLNLRPNGYNFDLTP
jgi:glycosyltransferase involved in cell wall biosynthesis/LmbE family N-acetylglucosaminyl deacetylase